MPEFSSIDAIKTAVRGVLGIVHSVEQAKRYISMLPPAIRGSHVVSDIFVRFNDDGTRTATFTIAQGHDDPDPKTVEVFWRPESNEELSDLVSPQ